MNDLIKSIDDICSVLRDEQLSVEDMASALMLELIWLQENIYHINFSSERRSDRNLLAHEGYFQLQHDGCEHVIAQIKTKIDVDKALLYTPEYWKTFHVGGEVLAQHRVGSHQKKFADMDVVYDLMYSFCLVDYDSITAYQMIAFLYRYVIIFELIKDREEFLTRHSGEYLQIENNRNRIVHPDDSFFEEGVQLELLRTSAALLQKILIEINYRGLVTKKREILDYKKQKHQLRRNMCMDILSIVASKTHDLFKDCLPQSEALLGFIYLEVKRQNNLIATCSADSNNAQFLLFPGDEDTAQVIRRHDIVMAVDANWRNIIKSSDNLCRAFKIKLVSYLLNRECPEDMVNALSLYIDLVKKFNNYELIDLKKSLHLPVIADEMSDECKSQLKVKHYYDFKDSLACGVIGYIPKNKSSALPEVVPKPVLKYRAGANMALIDVVFLCVPALLLSNVEDAVVETVKVAPSVALFEFLRRLHYEEIDNARMLWVRYNIINFSTGPSESYSTRLLAIDNIHECLFFMLQHRYAAIILPSILSSITQKKHKKIFFKAIIDPLKLMTTNFDVINQLLCWYYDCRIAMIDRSDIDNLVVDLITTASDEMIRFINFPLIYNLAKNLGWCLFSVSYISNKHKTNAMNILLRAVMSFCKGVGEGVHPAIADFESVCRIMDFNKVYPDSNLKYHIPSAGINYSLKSELKFAAEFFGTDALGGNIKDYPSCLMPLVERTLYIVKYSDNLFYDHSDRNYRLIIGDLVTDIQVGKLLVDCAGIAFLHRPLVLSLIDLVCKLFTGKVIGDKLGLPESMSNRAITMSTLSAAKGRGLHLTSINLKSGKRDEVSDFFLGWTDLPYLLRSHGLSDDYFMLEKAIKLESVQAFLLAKPPAPYDRVKSSWLQLLCYIDLMNMHCCIWDGWNTFIEHNAENQELLDLVAPLLCIRLNTVSAELASLCSRVEPLNNNRAMIDLFDHVIANRYFSNWNHLSNMIKKNKTLTTYFKHQSLYFCCDSMDRLVAIIGSDQLSSSSLTRLHLARIHALGKVLPGCRQVIVDLTDTILRHIENIDRYFCIKHLEKRPAESASVALSDQSFVVERSASPVFNQGDLVVISGLSGSAKYNGLQGQLLGYNKEKSRWQVCVASDDGDKNLLIKAENLALKSLSSACTRPGK